MSASLRCIDCGSAFDAHPVTSGNTLCKRFMPDAETQHRAWNYIAAGVPERTVAIWMRLPLETVLAVASERRREASS